MGVGKTTVGNILKEKLNNCIYLDGDWCWNCSPFFVNDEIKEYMLDNISHLLCNFLDCKDVDNIVLTWVMHEQIIIDTLLERLGDRKYNFYNYSLICSSDSLKARILKDVCEGIRQADVIRRSIERLPLYRKIDSVKINTDNITAKQTADIIKKDVLN